jgi:hypothetical protein
VSPTIWAAVISGVIALLIAFSTLLGTVIYRTGYTVGQLSTRVDSLETWRVNVRGDFHEVSGQLQGVIVQMAEMVIELRAVHKLIDDRTVWRTGRPADCPLEEPRTPKP